MASTSFPIGTKARVLANTSSQRPSPTSRTIMATNNDTNELKQPMMQSQADQTPVVQPTVTVQAAPVQPQQPNVYVASAPTQTVVMQPVDPNGPPFGAPAGGKWTTESYSGMVTLILVVVLAFFFWPACAAPLCCPCDTRQVYVLPNKAKYTRSGAMVPPNDCCGHPCGGPAY